MMKKHIQSGLFVLLGLAVACTPREKPLFELLDAGHTGVRFANTVTASDTFNVLRFEYIYNGGGVGVGDVNNDGLADLFFSGNMVPGKLYLNRGNFRFEDVTGAAGLRTNQWTTGVAMVDINADGRLDLHLSTVDPLERGRNRNLFFLNDGKTDEGVPTFTESAARMGLADSSYSTQAAFLDYDLDDDLDLYLLTNALESYNRNNVRVPDTTGYGKSTDKLFRNNGNGTFTDVSRAAGIRAEGWGLGIAVADFNHDGWPDVYCANDFQSNDCLYLNNGDGTFTNRIAEAFLHQSQNSMGTDVADINGDGLLDVVTLDMLPETNERQKSMFGNLQYDRFQMAIRMGYQPQHIRNTLQLNNGDGTFSEIGQLAGIHATDWSWGALFADYDNDGRRDLYITNGFPKDITDLDYVVYGKENTLFGTEESRTQKMMAEMNQLKGIKAANYLFQNQGNLRFENRAAVWGLDQPSYSNGAAYADLDNDGDLDLVVNNINDEAFVYRNHSRERLGHHYLRVRLKGKAPNVQGLGTKITLYAPPGAQYHEHALQRGYKSTVESDVHFGLGKAGRVDSLLVAWPDGRVQVLHNVKPDQTLTVDYRQAVDAPPSPARHAAPLFEEAPEACGLTYRHVESGYVDFKVEHLLPQMYSRGGPGMAVGDVNADGREDLYVGGAAGSPGVLFRQNARGTFAAAPFDAADKPYEDMGSLLFDADSDDDLDLYVVSGSSEHPLHSPYYQDRLYRNDGRGNFRIDTTALPRETESGSCVVAADYDRDGDLDLFVGGRIIPGRYPLPPKSFLLRNDGGRFTDVTQTVSRQLGNVGLVTSALWTDFDNDHWVDLVVAGEWMPIRFFRNYSGTLVPWDADRGSLPTVTGQTADSVDGSTATDHSAPGGFTFAQARGWWNSLVAGDFDNDGDTDYLAGNLGLNSRYQASPARPVRVYAKDYDGNNTLDPVLCYYLGDKSYPTHPRDALIDQMIGMRRRFQRYADYGKVTFEDMFTPEERQGEYEVRSEYFQSSYLENQGGGRFALRPLPVQAQFAPVFGMLVDDFNGDCNLDVLSVGNSYTTEPLAGAYDASIGLYLQGDGKGNFRPVPVTESGFRVHGDAKGIAAVPTATGQVLQIVSCNNQPLRVLNRPANRNVQVLQPGPLDASALVTLPNGKRRKEEFYYGSTYLSQSSRRLSVPVATSRVILSTYVGKQHGAHLTKCPNSCSTGKHR